MSKKSISEMTIEELELYREQLSEKLSVVNFYLRKKLANKRKNNTDKDK